MNAGQVCSAGTRLIIEEAAHDEMMDRMAQRIGLMDVKADVGPITTAPQLKKVGDYLALAEAEGLMPVTGRRADSIGGRRRTPEVL